MPASRGTQDVELQQAREQVAREEAEIKQLEYKLHELKLKLIVSKEVWSVQDGWHCAGFSWPVTGPAKP